MKFIRKRMPASLWGVLGATLFVTNLLLWSVPFFTVALLKLLMPGQKARRVVSRCLDRVGTCWIDCNTALINAFLGIDWRLEGLDDLEAGDSYLVACNHQSWVDIPVLQAIFAHRVPFLKFFLKQELIWVPILGLAWWALDFPFMKRYSKAYLKKHPEMRGKDLETTQRACRKFLENPVSVMNFLEGTRFDADKHEEQNAPFKHLLLPKAGGVAFAIKAMNGQIKTVLDVTIVYDTEEHDFWEFLCGKVSIVAVHVQALPIPEQFWLSDYTENVKLREDIQDWVNEIWEAKDQRIGAMRKTLTRPTTEIVGDTEI